MEAKHKSTTLLVRWAIAIEFVFVACCSCGAAPFTAGNILLTAQSPYSFLAKLNEYTLNGELVQSILVPAKFGELKDVSVDYRGYAQSLVGERPNELLTYNPFTGNSTNFTFPRWGNPNTPFGGLATFGKYTFCTSALKSSLDFKGGGIRIDSSSQQATFFGPDENATDVTLGLDGIIYVKYRNTGEVIGFNPITLEQVSRTVLQFNSQLMGYLSIAVDASGRIYGARRGILNGIDRYLPNGVLDKGFDLPSHYSGILDIDFSPDGSEIMVTDANQHVGFAKSDLTAFTREFLGPTGTSLYATYVTSYVPEPSAATLFAIGCLAISGRRRRLLTSTL